jgi:hypothetical protein
VVRRASANGVLSETAGVRLSGGAFAASFHDAEKVAIFTPVDARPFSGF